MIEIRKVEDPALAKQVCLENDIPYCDSHHVIATIEGKNILHSAVFSYDNEEGSIHAISGFGGDILLLDGLCRAILNIMDIKGVKVVYLPHKYEELAKKVGFLRKDNCFELQLEGFFRCSCSSKRSKTGE